MGNQRFLLSGAGLILLAVLLLAVVLISNNLFRGVQLDLTEDRLFTLNEGTRDLLNELEEPVNLYFFFSDEQTKDLPWVRAYADRIRTLLEQYERHGGDMVNLHVIDPKPFSAEEDRANLYGLRGIPYGNLGEDVYLGLAATNSVGDVVTIPVFRPDQEPFLEYEISRRLYSLVHPEKAKVGIVSRLPIGGGFDPFSGRPTPAWVIYEQINQLFEVEFIGYGQSRIPEDIDVLLVVHPKGFGDNMRYAIDQYLMGGGRAVFFVDPQSEVDTQGEAPGRPPENRTSSLSGLFNAWGVDSHPGQVVLDMGSALSMRGQDGRPVRHLAFLGLSEDRINDSDVITARLDTVNMGTVGHLSLTEGSRLSMEPLLLSSANSATVEQPRVDGVQDPTTLMEFFQPDEQRYVVAARFRGPLDSAFPDGPPPKPAEAEGEYPPNHLASAVEDVNFLVVSDTDMLANPFWVQVQSFGGQQIANAFASNGEFVLNALDNLSGSNAIIGIGGQGSFQRPFTRVEDIRRQAEARFREEEKALQAELKRLEQRITELQQSGEDDSAILSQELASELEQVRQRKAETRAKLRQVRFDMQREIDELGRDIKLINIGLFPLILTLVALAVYVLRRRRLARLRRPSA